MNGAFRWGLPESASTYAPEIDFGISLIHWAMVAIFVLWGVFFAYLLVRYQRREGVPAEYKHEGIWKSMIPDAIVLIFEIGLIVFYAIPGWGRIKIHFPKPEDSNTMEVVAEQFAWNVQYPGPDGKFGGRDPKFIDSTNVLGLDPEDPAGKDDIATLNEMKVPLGKPSLLTLSSKDVIHSFFIPAFRIKQDSVPGMRIPVWFEPTKEGTYEIGCAQLCGIGHANMRGDVQVLTDEAFQAWLKEQAAAKATQ